MLRVGSGLFLNTKNAMINTFVLGRQVSKFSLTKTTLGTANHGLGLVR